MGLDWEDIIAHAVVALFACGLLMDFYPHHAWLIATANAAIWGIREAIQDVRKGHSPPWPVRQSSQKWAEFIAPAIVGFALAAGVSIRTCGGVICA